MSDARNVLGSLSPLTGFVRDGLCRAGAQDIGSHTARALQKITLADLKYHALRTQGLPGA